MSKYVSEIDLIERWVEDNCEKGDFKLSGSDAWCDFVGWSILSGNNNKCNKQTFGKGPSM